MLRYDLCFPDEFMAEINKCPVVYFPLGAIEWHGWHMVLGNDSIKAYEICLKVAEVVGGVLMPPFYFGTDNAKRSNGKYLYGMDIVANEKLSGSCYYLPPLLYKEIVLQILKNFIRQGFKMIVLLTGHYPPIQRQILYEVKELIEKSYRVQLIALAEYELLADHEYMGDHAGKWETSILLHLYPELVNFEYYESHKICVNHLLGVDGNPEKASSRLGGSVIDLCVKNLSNMILNQLGKL